MSCPDCFRGVVSGLHPTGSEITLHGLPTYVAQPEDGVTPKGIVVIVTDAFGWDFVNNRVLSDIYAKKGGFIVYCPDFMDGGSMNPRAMTIMDKLIEPGSWLKTILYKPIYAVQAMSIAIPWMNKTKVSVTYPRVVSFVQALRTSSPAFPTNSLKVGVAGFCWGGKHAVLLCQDDASTRVRRHESQIKSTDPEPLIDCAFIAHPSNIEVPGDIEAITVPISVAVGDNDMVLKAAPAKQMKQILEAKSGHEVTILPGAKHGFAIRTHPDDEYEMECAEKAEIQAIKWFTKWFAL